MRPRAECGVRRLRRELRAAERERHPLARERIVEAGGIADEQRARGAGLARDERQRADGAGRRREGRAREPFGSAGQRAAIVSPVERLRPPPAAPSRAGRARTRRWRCGPRGERCRNSRRRPTCISPDSAQTVDPVPSGRARRTSGASGARASRPRPRAITLRRPSAATTSRASIRSLPVATPVTCAFARRTAETFTPSRTSTPAARAPQQGRVEPVAPHGEAEVVVVPPVRAVEGDAGGARRATCPRSGCGPRVRTAARASRRSSRRQASGETPSPQTLSRGKRASSRSRTSCPRRRSRIDTAVPAGPPPTTTTSRARVPLTSVLPCDRQQPVGPVGGDGRRDPGVREGVRQLARGEGAADRQQAVLDAHPRAEEEGERDPAERIGHARAAEVVDDERPARHPVELAQHARDVGAVEVMEEERGRHHVEAAVRER